MDADSAKLARGHAIAVAEATERAARFSSVKIGNDLAGRCAVVAVVSRAVGTRAVATHHSHHGVGGGNGKAENIGHLLHYGRTADGTKQSAHAFRLHASFGKSSATGKSAAAAVGTRKHSLHFIDARIFIHFEFLGNKKQDNGRQATNYTQSN